MVRKWIGRASSVGTLVLLVLCLVSVVGGAGLAIADRAACGARWEPPSAGAAAACARAVAEGRSPVSVTLFLLVGSACALVGWFVVARSRHLAGWLLLALGVAFTAGPAAGAYEFHATAAVPGSLPAPGVAGWLQLVLFDNPAVFVPFGLLLLTFPTGTTGSRRWSAVALVLVGGGVLAELGVAAETIRGTRFENGALGVVLAVSDVAEIPSLPAIALGTLAAIVAPIVRWRRAVGRERDQLRSFLRGAVVLGVLVVMSPVVFAVEWLWPAWPFVVAFAAGLVPVMIGAAIAGQGLFGLDRVVNRTAVYGVLTGTVVAAYVGAVTAVAGVFGHDGDRVAAVVVTAGVAVVFEPLRRRVQRAVDRVLFGLRSDVVAVTSALSDRMSLPPEGPLLGGLADAVAAVLNLPYVEIRCIDADVDAGLAGTRQDGTEALVELDLVQAGSLVGSLACLPRRAGGVLDRADREVLRLLVPAIAAAVHSAALAAALARSRERLVEAKEREQVRIRRDLHDGLGPMLTGIGMALADLGDRAVSDHDLVHRLKDEVVAAIGEIRRIAHDLEPIALAEHGLGGALAVQAERFAALGLDIDVEVSGADQIVGTAVERAAYRIVSEALNNVHRHANARSCAVRLRVDGHVAVEITDDGVGGATTGSGVGLRSMEERARELHGAVDLDVAPGGGTIVRVTLPVSP